MALILSGKNLEPLLNDPASMDSLRETIEEALRAHQREEITGQGGFVLPLADSKRSFRCVTASRRAAGAFIRVNPLFSGATDAHLNLLFDAQSGALLALLAGDQLSIWRTGTPAGIACRYLASLGAKTKQQKGSSPLLPLDGCLGLRKRSLKAEGGLDPFEPLLSKEGIASN